MENEDDVVEESMSITFHWITTELVEPAIRACRERLRDQGGFSQLRKRETLLGDFELKLQVKGPKKAVMETLLMARSIHLSGWEQFQDYTLKKNPNPQWDPKDLEMVKDMRAYLEKKEKTH